MFELWKNEILLCIEDAKSLYEKGILGERDCTYIVAGLHVLLKDAHDDKLQMISEDLDIQAAIRRLLHRYIGYYGEKFYSTRPQLQ